MMPFCKTWPPYKSYNYVNREFQTVKATGSFKNNRISVNLEIFETSCSLNSLKFSIDIIIIL